MPEPVAQIGQFMQPDWVANAGMWVGLIVALLVFSAILGDHWLARLGQTILVAAGLGYAAAVTWHAMIGLPFVQGLLADPRAEPWNWIPVILSALLVLAAAERILFQGEGGPPAGWIPPCAALGRCRSGCPAAGGRDCRRGGWHGTGNHAATVSGRCPYGDPLGRALRTILHGAPYLDYHSQCAGLLGIGPPAPSRRTAELGTAPDAGLGLVWSAAVWLAAGVIFARLLASRTSLLIAEFEFMRATFTSTGLWQIIQSWLPK